MGKGKRAHTISSAPAISSLVSIPRRTSGDLVFNLTPSSFLTRPSSQQLSLLPSKPSLPSRTLRWTTHSQPKRSYEEFEHKMENAPLVTLVLTYLNWFILILLGHLRDILGKTFKRGKYRHLQVNEGYAPLVSDFDSFYTRRLYMRVRDCWNRPITGVASRTVQLLGRTTKDYNKTFQLTGQISECLNFASYNYLGFAQKTGPCAEAVEQATMERGLVSGSPRAEAGSVDMHVQLEHLVANFVGKEATMIVSMGFATNATTIPALVGKGCLIISDELNHSSIVFGARLSGASVRVFKHNSMQDLHDVLRESISQGQPRTHRPWKKILVVVEGLYSMEGTIANIPTLLKLKDQFKFYLYVDEAHSIGAIGEHGGGVCDLYGIDPARVDILMGTFTKSFGAAGGYIAASKSVIDYLKLHNHAYVYAEPMPIPVIQQVLTSMTIICEQEEGKWRIQQLLDNSCYFASRLRNMGFIVYGDKGSPVIPLLLFNPAKIA
ncbi:pyridoxal phosphate-dependent transferase [Phascolomyces articulosus]|uniref:serine C-palmitoyltransferase n=1 Tax=Phascolomyces articulosus TaxID=60185 RepID=A0AAD5PIE6_9FUNG|nr:pyridoxal phosphate-dependent transferase [Phascolomyces articulosus]